MASISPNSSSQLNGKKTIDILGNIHFDENQSTQTQDDDEENPITLCEVLRQQNDALRQELHDIRREMDEITDQFRTEDAEEFKQLQAELEIAAKNCRILQFKLRKSEKRNENLEVDKVTLEDKIHELTRDNYRIRDLDEELLIAKEVSVRLHNELEKSEQTKIQIEQFNLILKENLDTLKDTLDGNQSNDYQTWQLAVQLYESLFREYFLLEELKYRNNNTNTNQTDLLQSYQNKISILNEEILRFKEDMINRDNELNQLRLQNKILKQRSQSVDRTSSTNTDDESIRSRRGVSVDGGGHLREQLDISLDEIRLLKNKLLRLEDELNNSVLEKETLLIKLDEQSKQNLDETMHDDLQLFISHIENLINLIKQNKSDEQTINDLQQTLRSSRRNKQTSDDELTQKANQLLTLIMNKTELLNKIRYHLTNLTYDASDTCLLLEELDTTKQQLEIKDATIQQLQITIENLNNSLKIQENETTRLNQINQKQIQDLRHMDQLRQSIITFEKKLDQKQTRVNELSMKIIEKEDIIETKVKECQKHRLELRELESKYYTLGKQLEEQINTMSKEMEKLNCEKEMLKFDLESLRLNQQNEQITKVSNIDDEINRIKNECRQQIIDGEIENYKLRINQLTKEKDDLLKQLNDYEKKYRDLQSKFDGNEQTFIRMKKDINDKQRKYDESIKMKAELQNAVDRLRQKLYDLELHNQDKQNKYMIDKQEWENHRVDLSGKINELEEQLSKVTKRQRKDLDIVWKKERTDLQKQLQQSQQLIKELQNQLANRETPQHIQEKLNILITENELLLNKIKDLELIFDDVHLLKSEMQRLRDKNSSDWNYWRKQQSDLYAQLRQQNQMKESILNKFDRLQKQMKGEVGNRLVRDISIGPISLNSFQNEPTTKTSLSNYSRETLGDDIELPHGTLDGRTVNTNEIAGTMDDSKVIFDEDKQRMFDKTYLAQENTAENIEEIASKIDRVEDHLFSYRRFMDFIRAKSEKSASIVRDDSFTNIVQSSEFYNANKRLASAPPENNPQQQQQRRSRFDTNLNNSHEQLSTSAIEQQMTSSMIAPTTNSSGDEIGSSKNRFFSLSRRFRFRVQSPDKSSSTQSASVHFNDEDIDLETKQRTTRKSDKDGNRPSKGILKTLRHRSPFRFRSKDAVIPEQEPSPPPPPPPPPEPQPKETSRPKIPPVPPTQTKQRGRLVELKKTVPKTASPTTRKTTTPAEPPAGSTLVRRTSGLKDLIHKFEITPSDRSTKSKRTTNEPNQDEQSPPTTDVPSDSTSKPVDIPDLLQNVDKEPPSSQTSRPTLKHSNSNRQTTSFDSNISMVSASESITTNSSFRRPTSTARPLMISLSKDES